MNFAAIHSLPVLFVVENNKFAISVPLHLQMHIDSVAVRGAAYGMPGVSVDGTDPVESYAAVKEAVERARRGRRPDPAGTTLHPYHRPLVGRQRPHLPH